MSEVERRSKHWVELVKKKPDALAMFERVAKAITDRLDAGETVEIGVGEEKEYGVNRDFFVGVTEAIAYGFVNGKKYGHEPYAITKEGDPIKYARCRLKPMMTVLK